MLTTISWSQFALAAGLCLLLYYSVITLLFFRRTLRTWLSRGAAFRRFAHPGGRAASTRMTEPALPVTPSQLVDADTLVVAPAPLQEQAQAAAALRPEEVMTDLLAELQDLLDLTAGNPAGKADFCQLLRLVIARYGTQLPGHLQDQVKGFLLGQARERLPFTLSAADLQACWPSAPARV